jgi:VCBS repeat-containing protein
METDLQGQYAFQGVADGTYHLQFFKPSGSRFTTENVGADDTIDSDVDVTGRTGDIVVSGANVDHVDAGLAYLSGVATISGRAWLDTNADGVEDPDEPGLAGVRVAIQDEDGNTVETADTASDGTYQFTNVRPGSYTVVFTPLPGMSAAVSGQNWDLTVSPGDTITSVDAGMFYPTSVTGMAWNDADADGIRGSDEDPLADVSIFLLDDSGELYTTSTDADGAYTFTDLVPGHYTVAVLTPSHLSPAGQGTDPTLDSDFDPVSAIAVLDLRSGQDVTHLDAGVIPNAKPVGAGDSYSVAHGHTLSVAAANGVLANDSDDDEDDLTAVLADGVQHGTLTLNSNGGFVYTPDAGFAGTDGFTYRPTDQYGPGDVVSVTIDVTDNPPAAGSDEVETTTGVPITISVLWNDYDPDGDPITVSAVTPGAHGATTINTDGTVTYTPAAGFHGTDTFTYTLSDGLGGTATGMVVVAVNAPPVAVDDAARTAQNTAVVVPILANDSDPDGDTVTRISGTQPANGVVVFFATQALYTPFTDFFGQDVFTYTISDGHGHTATARVTVTVVAPPTAPDRRVTVYRDTPTDITLRGVDPNHPTLPLTYRVTARPTHGTLSGTAPNLTYTPASGYRGTDSFQYTVSNGVLTSAPGTVLISVTSPPSPPTPPANYPPVANSQSVTTPIGTPVAVVLTGSDSQSLPLTYTVIAGPSHGTLSGTAPRLSYTPAPGYVGPDSFRFTTSNGTATSAPATVSIQVTVRAPVAFGGGVTTGVGTPVAVTLAGGDPNAPPLPLTFAVVAGPTHGTLSGTAPNLTYTPAPGYVGPDSVRFTVSNGYQTSTPATVYLNVTNAQASIAGYVWNDTTVDGVWGTTEGPRPGVTVHLLNGSETQIASTVSGLDGSYSFAGLAAGAYQVEFVRPDGYSLSPQVLSGGGQRTSKPDPQTRRTPLYQLAATQHLTEIDAGVWRPKPTISGGLIGGFVWGDTNGNGVWDAGEVGTPGVTVGLLDGSGNLVTTTTTDGTGSYSFGDLPPGTYSVGVYPPSGGSIGTQGASNAVNPVTGKTAPIAVGQNQQVVGINGGLNLAGLGGAVRGFLWADADRNGLWDPWESGQGDATVELLDDDGAVVATTDSDADGFYSFAGLSAGTYWVVYVAPPDDGSDGGGVGTTFAPVSGTIGPLTLDTDQQVGDADGGVSWNGASPGAVAWDDWASTSHDTPAQIDVLADTWSPGGGLTVVGVTQGANGTAVIDAGGTVTYTPNPGFSGIDWFTYVVTGGTAATVTVIVAPDSPPVGVSDSVTTNEDAAVSGNVLANDTDADGDTLTAALVSGPFHGSLTLNPDGSFTYTPAADWNGSDGFVYQVSDGFGGVSTATVSISVNPVNDPPVFTAGAGATVPEDAGPQRVSGWAAGISSGPADEAWQSLAFYASTDNPALFSTQPAVDVYGNLTYTPAANANGTATVTVYLRDTGGTANGGVDSSAVATFTITITPVNDPPAAAGETYVFHATDLSVAATVGVLANDTDVDGDTLTAILWSGPSHGTLSLNPDGSFDYTPGANWSGTDSFVYRPYDGAVYGDPVTVNIELTDSVPTAYNLVASTEEGVTVYIAADGTDPDGDPLTIVGVTQGSYGTVGFDARAGYLIYTPQSGYVGSDSFTYTLSDGFGGTATGSVGMTVTPAPGSVAGWVFDDGYEFVNKAQTYDEDGLQSPGGAGYAGVTVRLLDTSGNLVATTTTDQFGRYLFSNVPVGDYKVKVDLPAGDAHNWYGFSAEGQGSDQAVDSDTDASGYTAVFTVTSYSTVHRDAGVIWFTDDAT